MRGLLRALAVAGVTTIGALHDAHADTVKFAEEADHSKCGVLIMPDDRDSPGIVIVSLQVGAREHEPPSGVFRAAILLLTPTANGAMNKTPVRIASAQLTASGQRLNIPSLSADAASDAFVSAVSYPQSAAMMRNLARPPITLELALDAGAIRRYTLNTGLSDSDAQSLDRCLTTLGAGSH